MSYGNSSAISRPPQVEYLSFHKKREEKKTKLGISLTRILLCKLCRPIRAVPVVFPPCVLAQRFKFTLEIFSGGCSASHENINRLFQIMSEPEASRGGGPRKTLRNVKVASARRQQSCLVYFIFSPAAALMSCASRESAPS